MPAGRAWYTRASVAHEGGMVETTGAGGVGLTPIVFESSLSELPDAPATPVSSTGAPFIFTSDNSYAPPQTPPRPIRRSTRKKIDSNHIPRPPNAFMLFRSWFINSGHVPTEVETNHGTLSKIIGFAWRRLAEEDKQSWHDEARTVLAEHKRIFPTYVYRPTRGSNATQDAGVAADGSKTKRKVREVPLPNDLRCEKIAELVADGMTGAELDSAMKDFDKHNVPQIVPRFQAPVTAGTFEAAAAAAATASAVHKRSTSAASVSSRSYQQQPSPPTNVDSHKLLEPFSLSFDHLSTDLDLGAFSFFPNEAVYDYPSSSSSSVSNSYDPSISMLPSPVHTSFDLALQTGAPTSNVDVSMDMNMDVLALLSGGLLDGAVDPFGGLGGGSGGYAAPAPALDNTNSLMYLPASALSHTDLVIDGYPYLEFTRH
ncbi:hypothetical protein FB45DRAFT_999919 [Roridomyces roridus]|uniref:HMG box domain-containing protein n=1 Tax=Roridomyces roridus TaxID=1738132 RepID=A0AAD7C787_9AGAR|nr:hypothetical protein FB45DRAFT_999919 [Roridomyces roridus]